MLAENIVYQIIQLTEGKLIGSKSRRDEQLAKLLKLLDEFMERNPQYK